MRRSTFPLGGIRPVERKGPTRAVPCRNASIPATATVSLTQGAAPAAVAVVAVGERVREGMVIGRGRAPGSANVHSPIPGIVRDVRTITLPGGVSTEAVIIDLEGEFDRLGKRQTRREWGSLEPGTLVRLVRDAGVVGMGGDGYATHQKLVAASGRSCDYLIVNGCESEPYLSADHRIMVEQPAAVVEGACIAAAVVQPRRVVIGVEANKRDAAAALGREIRSSGLSYRVVILDAKYPQGDEKQLIRAISGREVPSGGEPSDVGCVVLGCATALAIRDAVVFRAPVLERIVTVCGGAVARPANLKVRIGTPIGRLLAECGGLRRPAAAVVVGGPLQGHAATDLGTPVTKTTCGVLALTDREVRHAPTSDCIRCGRCVEACPMGLEPTRLFKLIDHHEYGEAVRQGLLDCTECGSCGYVCPARIPLVTAFRVGKASLYAPEVVSADR